MISVASVTLDGITITDHRLRRDALWRDPGWGGTDSEVVVTYSHGYATVPDDLAAVCRTASLRLVSNPEAVITRMEIPGEYSEARAGPFGFTIAEQLVLNRYRRRSLP